MYASARRSIQLSFSGSMFFTFSFSSYLLCCLLQLAWLVSGWERCVFD